MALQYLTASAETNKTKGSAIWEGENSKATPGNGNTFLLIDLAGKVESWLVSLVVTSGTGKVQYTNSIRSKVLAGTAIWYDWNDGVVAANTNDVFFNVSAVRLVNVTGTTLIEVRVS